ncbi:phosphatase PAP2 family protein [Bradyrhizobium pachyrhizi]|uniref:phosphatase PAP2 family protein n=1 Tax=Bradyrhizobium pachyrhizi TaxID=280333 RepID=UPI000B1EA3B2
MAIAQTVARNTTRRAERISRGLTWGTDEKILLVLAVGGRVASRGRSEQLQRAGNHALLVAVAASLLPHGMKSIFDQTRPDRKTVLGHVHGVSFSGKREDAFPSGHALHMGELTSAASMLPPGPRRAIQVLAVRPFADEGRRAGALGGRCRRGLRTWRLHRASAEALDRLSAAIEGG